jgi:hypothetical protein
MGIFDMDGVGEIIAWCEKIREGRNNAAIIPNPFAKKFPWSAGIINIQIDKPTSVASPNDLVYDSITKTLYRHVAGTWVQIGRGGKSVRPQIK